MPSDQPSKHAAAVASALSPPKLWAPPPSLLASSHMTQFATHVAKKRNLEGVRFDEPGADPVEAYKRLFAYSTDSVSDFWRDVAEYAGVRWSVPPAAYGPMVDQNARMDSIPEWFADSRLNFAENLLLGPVHAKLDPNACTIIATTEEMQLEMLTRAQLTVRVRVMAAAFASAGVVIGDRIGGYTANCVDAVVAMLAAASMGAVWSSASPDFGVSVREAQGERNPMMWSWS